MKALKIFLIILAVIAALYFGSAWFLSENLDRIVKETVEEVGSEQLETSISLDSVAVSIREARATLKGLTIANPEGFSSDPVFVLGSIEVDIDLKSLTEDVLVIQEITIRDPQVNFEMNEKGVSNLDVLQEKIGGHTSSSRGDDSKRLIIERLDFKGGKIRATAAIKPDEELVFDFPVIFMTDLGRPDGATADEIGEEVSAVLLERSMSAAKRAGVDRLVDEQKEKLMDKAEEKLGEKLKDLLKRD